MSGQRRGAEDLEGPLDDRRQVADARQVDGEPRRERPVRRQPEDVRRAPRAPACAARRRSGRRRDAIATVDVQVMIPVASVSYITAAGSENPLPDAAISGRPKKPVLPTAVATITAPARGALHAPDAHRHPHDAEQDEVDGVGRRPARAAASGRGRPPR